jgi:hypothetical protein
MVHCEPVAQQRAPRRLEKDVRAEREKDCKLQTGHRKFEICDG